MCVYATCTKSLSRNAYKKPWKRLSLFCLDLLPPLCLQWVWVSVSCAIVWKWLYTPSCTKSPIMPKHNKNTVGYMFSRSPHKSADILLERKCAATSESNRSCVFVFVCETTVVVLIPQPDPTLHWSCNDPPVSLQARPPPPCLILPESETECWIGVRVRGYVLALTSYKNLSFTKSSSPRWSSSSAAVKLEITSTCVGAFTLLSLSLSLELIHTHWASNQLEFVMNINERRLLHSESTGGQQSHYTAMSDP